MACRLQKVNVPVYGAEIPKAIMKLFESQKVRDLASKLNIHIPEYKLQSFVQGKMFKVKDLVQAARALGTCDGPASRLEAFVDEFEALTEETMPNAAAWQAFMDGHLEKASSQAASPPPRTIRPSPPAPLFAQGWARQLHFDLLLQNFGFDDATAAALAQTPPPGRPSENLREYAFRWLGKACAGYNITGCLTDVANLIFAMAELPHIEYKDLSKLSELKIADKISDVADRINAGRLARLWVPTHFVHDCESDDLLCWLLLEHIHRELGSELEVLVQSARPRSEPHPPRCCQAR